MKNDSGGGGGRGADTALTGWLMQWRQCTRRTCRVVCTAISCGPQIRNVCCKLVGGRDSPPFFFLVWADARKRQRHRHRHSSTATKKKPRPLLSRRFICPPQVTLVLLYRHINCNAFPMAVSPNPASHQAVRHMMIGVSQGWPSPVGLVCKFF